MMPSPQPATPAAVAPLAGSTTGTTTPSRRSLRALDLLAFFAPDIQGGVGPFLVVFMAGTLAWDPQRIGTVMFVSALVALIVQAPAGALVDRVEHKPRWVAGAISLIAVCLVVMANRPSYGVILAGQSIIVAAGTLVAPAIASTSLGLVGRAGLDSRIGRNAALTAAGTLVWAMGTGWVAHYYGPHAMFFYAVAMAVPTIAVALLIRQKDIDNRVARGGDGPANASESAAAVSSGAGTTDASAAQLAATSASASGPIAGPTSDAMSAAVPATASAAAWATRSAATSAAKRWYDHRLFVLLGCAFLFHLANAAMLTLVAQKVGTQAGTSATLWLAGGVIITQFVTIPIGLGVGRYAPRLARKPIFLVGFAVLPLRGLLYLWADSPTALLSLQVLDGIGAGIFGVMLTLMIGDLTRGSGHFSFALGLGAVCVGLGAALSNLVAGTVAQLAGYHSAFLMLAGVAAVALLLFAVAMPETRHKDASAPPDPKHPISPLPPAPIPATAPGTL